MNGPAQDEKKQAFSGLLVKYNISLLLPVIPCTSLNECRRLRKVGSAGRAHEVIQNLAVLILLDSRFRASSSCF